MQTQRRTGTSLHKPSVLWFLEPRWKSFATPSFRIPFNSSSLACAGTLVYRGDYLLKKWMQLSKPPGVTCTNLG